MAPVTIAGEIRLRVEAVDGRATSVSVVSGRPLEAVRLLRGRTPVEALRLVPALFSICGKAQGAASAAVLAAAAGARLETPDNPRLSCLREAALDSLWRLLLDWPQAAGQEAKPGLLAEARKLLSSPSGATQFAERLDDVLCRLVLGEPGASWRERLAVDGDWQRWMEGCDTPVARALSVIVPQVRPVDGQPPRLFPSLAQTGRLAYLAGVMANDPTFARLPRWGNQAVETGALARQFAHPVLAAAVAAEGVALAHRFVARLLDLAEMPERACRGDWPLLAMSPEKGKGIACVETARGTLLHAVMLEAGKIIDYRIVAPTEWNFHPQASWLSAFAGMPAAEAQDAVTLAALAVDPCVPYRVEVVNA